MNHLVEHKQPLLDKFGQLSEPGYATKEIFEYNPDMIAASHWRIKEWDYYALLSDNFGLSVTVADLGYLGMVSICYFDFENKDHICKTKKVWFPFGKMNLPKSIHKGDVYFNQKGVLVHIKHQKDRRRMIVEVNRFFKKENLRVDVELHKMNDDHMTIATPWKEHPKAFYYNQKVNCIPVSGDIYLGVKHHLFNPKNDFAVLDWGRGVWTYKNTWYWGSFSTVVDGKRVGLNMGYGFGDSTQATENMIVVDGKAHKLDLIRFEFDPDDVMELWMFISNNERLQLTMKPLIDRQDDTNLLFIKNKGHQVFGLFNGYLVLDDGEKIEINDVIGFAETITNHY